MVPVELQHGLVATLSPCGKIGEGREIIPQRLKPVSFCELYGTAEAVPLQGIEFFRGCENRAPVRKPRVGCGAYSPARGPHSKRTLRCSGQAWLPSALRRRDDGEGQSSERQRAAHFAYCLLRAGTRSTRCSLRSLLARGRLGFLPSPPLRDGWMMVLRG